MGPKVIKEEKMDKKAEEYENVTELKEMSAPDEIKTETKAAAMPEPAVRPVAAGEEIRWGEKNVTRKFLSIALAAALALNVVISAGVMKLIGPHKGFNRESYGRPGNEQRFDNNRGGRGNMMPPSGNQLPGNQQNQQPDDQQDKQPDNQQNESQQSEDKNSSDQEKA